MRTYPALDPKTNINESPHVFILGAGASRATFPNGDKHGRRLPLMPDLVEVLNLEPIFEKHGLVYGGENFEQTYDAVVSCGRFPEFVEETNQLVSAYFSSLCIPDEPTLYDELILSLRHKDIIATFNWDPLLAQAYQRNIEAVGYDNLPKVVFLHGNVAVGLCYKCKAKGWIHNNCMTCGGTLDPSRLLYPVSNKNYSDDEFLQSEWELVRQHINKAYFITVFGYSAPVTDAEARELMLSVWKENTTRDLAQLEVIDIRDESELKDTWSDFIVRNNYMFKDHLHKTYLAIQPRRTCDAFAMASLQQNPWEDNPAPTGLSLADWQEFIRPLLREEVEGHFSGNPCELKDLEGANRESGSE